MHQTAEENYNHKPETHQGSAVSSKAAHGAGEITGKVVSKTTTVKNDTADEGVLGKCNCNHSNVPFESCHISDMRPKGVTTSLCDIPTGR